MSAQHLQVRPGLISKAEAPTPGGYIQSKSRTCQYITLTCKLHDGSMFLPRGSAARRTAKGFLQITDRAGLQHARCSTGKNQAHPCKYSPMRGSCLEGRCSKPPSLSCPRAYRSRNRGHSNLLHRGKQDTPPAEQACGRLRLEGQPPPPPSLSGLPPPAWLWCPHNHISSMLWHGQEPFCPPMSPDELIGSEGDAITNMCQHALTCSNHHTLVSRALMSL